MREGALLDEAVEYCKQRGLEFYAINKNYPEETATHEGYSRKLQAELFIDDRNIGGLPSWPDIYRMIEGKEAPRHTSTRGGTFTKLLKKIFR